MEEDIDVVGMAENGQAAVEFCEKHRPDVVLMDIHMPRMDGIIATRIIKKSWPQIKVIGFGVSPSFYRTGGLSGFCRPEAG